MYHEIIILFQEAYNKDNVKEHDKSYNVRWTKIK